MTSRARLVHDSVRDQPMLLSPERGLCLNPVAHQIVQLCDGSRTTDELVEELRARFPETPSARVAQDARRFLGELQRRGLIEHAEP